ncbi:hypothetical protein PpBr36_00931 [Pyricularia pennisetigena]|uniref:hypothetical protein n=1 Tax=Pyricularia pennisetigena TaxID=1578925 RepID=UPI00114FAF7A|nr:hypothetical protein PpBr36_00931 [Pyricularia pennisetigena]TLS28159.1 hypothetical protein PpBr36_00931 [Pyricularia pennisetigena]
MVAMDALKNLSANIPDWLKRLDELSGQIEQRQLELAKIAEAHEQAAKIRSLKNKGSTESLRPTDESTTTPTGENDGPAKQSKLSPTDPADPATTTTTSPVITSEPRETPSLQPTPSGQLNSNHIVTMAEKRARRNMRKRIRTDSVLSADDTGEGAAPKSRCRGVVLVYYDSYVQSFFEELVKFVSASRNLMRKAKMAAKVAQIKRMAEMEVPDDDEDDDGINGELKADPNVSSSPGPMLAGPLTPSGPVLEASPISAGDGEMDTSPLNYVSTKAMRYGRASPGGPNLLRPAFARAAARGAYSGSGLAMLTTPQVPDAFDALDKGLDFVQATCEQAAHQFLRDGDCDEDIVKLKARLAETAELASKEMERRLKEDPDVDSTPEPVKSRSYRLQSMRRESATSTHKGIKERVPSPAPLVPGSPLDPSPPLLAASPEATMSPPIAAPTKTPGSDVVILHADARLEADGPPEAIKYSPRDRVDYRVLNTVH